MDGKELEQQILELKSRQVSLESENKKLSAENESLKATNLIKAEKESQQSMRSRIAILANRFGLPSEISQHLNVNGMSESEAEGLVELLARSFKTALDVNVAAEVDQRFGNAGRVVDKGGNGSGLYSREQIQGMSTEDIQKNWDRVQESLKRLG